MSQRVWGALVVIVLAATAACQRRIELPPSPAQASTPWIEIHRSGGIAGLQTTLTLRSDGAFAFVTRHACTAQTCAPIDTASGMLATDSLAAIQKATAALPIKMFASYGPTAGWADQYLYDISVAGRDSTFHASGDDGSLPVQLRDWNTRVFTMIAAARAR